VARRVGDDETADMCDTILAQERQAAERVAAAFPDAVEASLDAQGFRL
jgi:ferritin-like metal-binding protein YciE